jgi:4-amino-4-deoxy-L-arabinose transferase-like glycosyltransferase
MVTSERPPPSTLGTVLPALGAGLIGLGLSVATLLPGVALWDTAELQTVGPLLGTGHPTGFPTWVVLGWLASVVLQPFGEPAFRMNLLNALCMAVAAGLTSVLVGRLTGRPWLAFATGVLLVTTPVAWAIGTHADTHALLLALTVLLLVLLVDWERLERAGGPGADRRLIGSAVVFGLALGSHGLILLLAPWIALFVLAVAPGILRRRRLVAACLVTLVATVALVYLELPLRAGPFRAPLVYGHPETWDGFWAVVLAAQFQGSLVAPFSDLGAKAVALGTFAADQLGPLVWLVPFGLVATIVRRPRYALLTGPTLGLMCWFAGSYDNAQIDRYYLVSLVIALTWIAILAAAVVDVFERRVAPGRLDRHGARASAPVVVVLVAGLLLVPAMVLLPSRRAAVDESRDLSGAEWLDAVLDESVIGRDAVVLSWWSYSTPLWYAQQIEGRRPDIRIVDDRTRLDEGLGDIPHVIDANLGRRPVIVIQVDPKVVASLASRYRLTQLAVPGPQVVYRVDAVLAVVGGR